MTIQDVFVSAVGDLRGVAAADRLCEACVQFLEVDAAALSLVFDGASTGTFGASGDAARVYDELQFTMGEGPCLESVRLRAPVLVVDLTEEDARWPAYGPAMLAHTIRAVFALPVLVSGVYLGALDLFRVRPGSLEGDDLSGALTAADLAQWPVLDLMASDLAGKIADPSSESWSELDRITRVEVSQAVGMLVAQLDVGPAEALVRLRAHAYATGASATDVARAILERRLRLEDDR